ncbi:MAG: hypothetical protein LC122_10125 [Chitinophagales bacterium]|nr:hypothetical protein [Chitinophagales bacterium]
MSNEILFKEIQKFRQWWLWIIILIVDGIFLLGFFIQVILGKQFGDKPMTNQGLIIAVGLLLLINIIFANVNLETFIKNDGIYFRFFPFHLKFKHYAWNELSKIYIRQYEPLKEYGGWGIRFSLSGKGKAFNVYGNIGLQLEFNNKKKVLIGTNKPNELTKALEKLNQLKK